MIKLSVNQFAELMSQIRSGDDVAATELLRLYEPEIRREIRLRLSDPRLRRVVDSIDISQSVFGNFFVRASYGEFELERPEQLLGLLIRMATNKVIDQHRRETSRKMDQISEFPIEDQNVVGKTSTASEVIAGKEWLERVRELLTEDEKMMRTCVVMEIPGLKSQHIFNVLLKRRARNSLGLAIEPYCKSNRRTHPTRSLSHGSE